MASKGHPNGRSTHPQVPEYPQAVRQRESLRRFVSGGSVQENVENKGEDDHAHECEHDDEEGDTCGLRPLFVHNSPLVCVPLIIIAVVRAPLI